MPANTFGPGDNFDPEWSHVIAGFTGRAHKAKMQNKPPVVIWGSGKPIREFNSSDDLVEVNIVLLSDLDQSWENVATFLAGTKNESPNRISHCVQGLPPAVWLRLMRKCIEAGNKR